MMKIQRHVAVFKYCEIQLPFFLERKANLKPKGICKEFYSLLYVGYPDKWVDLSKALPKLADRKWYSRVPHGYARGWEPVLYVNNIRNYYNILRWITGSEEEDEPEVELTKTPVLMELASR